MGLGPGDPFVDHINRNGLDNRKENLRIATPSQNGVNSIQSRGNVSGFRGVKKCYPDHYSRPFNAKLNVDGKLTNLGYFASAREAAEAYDEAAVEYYGDYAMTNRKMGLL